MLRVLFALVVASLAAADPAAAQLTRISGASALPRSCEGRTAQRSAEVAPVLATFAADPNVTVAAWQQDPYRVGGGAAALGVAWSRDGGASWTRAQVPGMTGCRGTRGRVGAPSLAFGAEGTAYLAGAPGTLGRRGLHSRVVVSVSRDGGAAWSPSVRLAGAGLNEAPSVAADPVRPGRAYVVWGGVGRVSTAATVDAGRTWSEPRRIARGQILDAGSIAVLADGTLLHGYLRAGTRSEIFVVARSGDGGLTWSRPKRVGLARAVTPVDARTGIAVNAASLARPAIAAAPAGGAYAAWTTRGRGGRSRAVVARSRDGGRTWSRTRRAIAGRRHQFGPALAVGPDGAPAVSAYRLHRGARADVVAAVSSDRGRSWRVQRLTRTFSLRRAPRALGGQRFLGPTALTATAPGGFSAALALPRNVFLARTR